MIGFSGFVQCKKLEQNAHNLPFKFIQHDPERNSLRVFRAYWMIFSKTEFEF